MDLKFSVFACVSRPVHEVFEAVADPARLSCYFTTGGAEGRLEEGATVTFQPVDGEPGRTRLEIAEEGWRETEAGLAASYGNCMGWSQMLAALKAWVEHGINLREGMYR